MTGRDPRTEKTREYRRAPHGTQGPQCQGTLPPTFGTRNGWPAETRVRCHRRIGVANGYCPAHRNQNPIEAVWDAMTPQERDAATHRALRPDPDFHHRLRAEMEEGYREAMNDAGRGSLLRG